MADGSIYEFHLNQTLFGQVVKNVFHYQSRGASDPTNTLGEIAVAWGTGMIAAVSNVQCSNVEYVSIYIRHLAGDMDEATVPLSATTGAVVGDCLPPHDAFAFRFNRTSTLTRHGQKRIAGVPEGAQDDGVALAGGVTTSLEAAAAQMEHIIVAADGLSIGSELWPVIYSKYLNGELRGEVVGGVFVPMPISNLVSSVQYVRISTQNTRKLYR